MKNFPPSGGFPVPRARRAFTLIELLVVISIIALLAGLVVGLTPIAITKMRRSRVEAERDALITMIEAYHKAKGFYPPDNTNNIVQTTLFYELTGTVLTNNYFVSIRQEKISPANLPANFNGITGFLNSSADPTEVQNFCGQSLKTAQYATVYLSPGPGTNTVLGIAVPGPQQLVTIDRPYINPWYYVATNPTNNPTTFDLWMDVFYAGKTNRISNWSKDPQLL